MASRPAPSPLWMIFMSPASRPLDISLSCDLRSRSRLAHGSWPLLAQAAVDALAEQGGGADVTGVLLNHPAQPLAQRHRAAAAAVLVVGVVGGDVEAGRGGHEP